MPTRPTGREKHVTSGGTGVHKGEQYHGSGPVGRESSQSTGRPQSGRNASSGGSYPGGSRGSGGGGGLLRLIIIGIIVLLGGGGGIGALLGGGGSSSGTGSTGSSAGSASATSSSSAASGYSQPSTYTGFGHGSGGYTSYSGSGSGSSQTSSSSDYGIGGYSASDLLQTLLGGGYDTGYGSSYGTGSGSSAGTSTTAGSGSGSYGSYGYAGSADDYDTSTISGSDSGLDLSSLADLFGAGVSNSAAGISTGWNDGRDNRGVLNTQVASGSRSKFTKLAGNGRDTVTLMIYMCGTDLESKAGMATSDLSEMANADLSDNVNVLVYTGGCTGWRNSVISARTNQIYRVRKGGLERLVEDDGDRVMTDPATLTRFIKWSAANFPASRYQLIFWDHGSGSLSGYGYDQKHQRAGSMDLAGIRDAVENGGVKFDFVGFDACLMATVENALALSNSADYLLASEETEPGTGWYYTNWLSKLSSDTSMSTLEIGKRIIDDFVDVSAQKARGQDTTLSLVDLAELQNTFPQVFSDFSKDTGSLIKGSNYKTVSTARKSSREFATSNRIDQVDLTDLAWKLGTDEGKELASVLLGAIKYNRTSTSMCNSYGLSIYFPGSRLSKVDSMVSTYKELGIDSDYTRCIQQYATVSASGQAATGGTSSVFDMLSGYTGSSGAGGYSSSGSGYGSGSYGSGSYGSGSYGTSSLSGMGSDLLMDLVGSFLTGRSTPIRDLDASNTDFIAQSGLSTEDVVETLSSNALNADALVWDTSTGQHILRLDEAQWEQVAHLTLNMLVDDGEGYIDLGEDNTFLFTQAGDLQGETDRTWLSINGHPVAFYHISTTQENGGSTTVGRVPCLLNGEHVNLIIAFDETNPYGYIAGARYDYVDGETETLAKAMTQLTVGDRLDFLCDYYSYDGTYESSYILQDPVYVEDVMVISNTDIGEDSAIVTYRFEDLYGQSYWTEPIRQ